MSKKLWIIIGSIVGFVAIAVTIVLVIVLNNKGTEPQDDYRSIIVYKLNGDVSISRKDKDLPAYQDMNLRNGDTITTGNGANSVLKLDSDKFIYIGENSNINLVSSEKDSSKTVIRVNEGSIVTEVKNKLSDLEEFGVETPNSSMAIRGTIFSVQVIKESNQIKIGYKLLEGSIELSVIEKTTSGFNVGKFNIKPMEEINILSKGDGILQQEDLTSALDKIYSNDQNVITKSYQTVEEYISETDKIELVEKELVVQDVEDILRNLPTNVTNESIRLVTINATFTVNGLDSTKTYMKYDSNSSFTVTISAAKSNKTVIGWMINGESVDGNDELVYEVTKTTVIEPIYQTSFSSGVTIRPTSYTTINVVSYGMIEEETSIKSNDPDMNFEDASSVSLSYEDFNDPDGNIAFLGWYSLDQEDNYSFISREKSFTYPVEKPCVITPLFAAIEEMPILNLTGNSNPITNDTLFSIDMNKGQEFTFTIGDYKVPLSAASLGLSYDNKPQPTIEEYMVYNNGTSKFSYVGDYSITWSFYSVNDEQTPIFTETIMFSARDVYFTLTTDGALVDTYEGLSSVEGYYYSENTYLAYIDENGNNISPSYFTSEINTYENYEEYHMEERTGDLSSISFDMTFDSDRFTAYTVDLNFDIMDMTDDTLTLYSSSSTTQGDYKYLLLIDNRLTTENLAGTNVDDVLNTYNDGNADASMVKLISFDSIPS